MKRTLQRITVLIAFCAAVFAPVVAQETDDDQQPPKEKLAELKAQKSAYITTKLNLSTEQAQQFWPIYNEYDAKQDAIRKEARELSHGARNSSGELSESQAAEMIVKHLANRQQEVDLEKQYAEKFKKSIGSVKTVQLRLAEQDFNREVLRRLKERMGSRSGDQKFKR
ncbi:MAG: hypothetical protein IPI00_03440 [Flavobacteriales bacterium]|nr:hypothetical protein [Flavobacteriales bacterium]MBK6944884.1 hypothetical protein [Flavobacteriales bacterium]MBK7239234.1 hypothetical protein [Flavobacteriales bacterium]MBK7297488.1 hypothetical protein [Flavobacteriales bacterium]MBK9535562.1 hypothetical protein [Flavobacteriales bacterium]